ncbi:MAG: hypothetical protein KDE03_05825 [Rhodobacteraceae bacterium]|nr:hypothetical protein [Paracoccaceae bacterium]
MLVFWKERLVYLATPKTGSTAIETALAPFATLAICDPPELKHTTVQRYRRFLQPFLGARDSRHFTVLAVMREPVDWLGSWYRYRQRDDIRRADRRTAGLSFEAFIDGYLADTPPEYARVGTQSDFLTPSRGAGPDRLFRYENMPALVRFLEDRLDRAITLPEANVSPKAATDLSAETLGKLRRHMDRDFRLYESIA